MASYFLVLVLLISTSAFEVFTGSSIHPYVGNSSVSTVLPLPTLAKLTDEIYTETSAPSTKTRFDGPSLHRRAPPLPADFLVKTGVIRLRGTQPEYRFPVTLHNPGYYTFGQWAWATDQTTATGAQYQMAMNTAGFYQEVLDVSNYPLSWGYRVVAKTWPNMHALSGTPQTRNAPWIGSIDHVCKSHIVRPCRVCGIAD